MECCHKICDAADSAIAWLFISIEDNDGKLNVMSNVDISSWSPTLYELLEQINKQIKTGEYRSDRLVLTSDEVDFIYESPTILREVATYHSIKETLASANNDHELAKYHKLRQKELKKKQMI